MRPKETRRNTQREQWFKSTYSGSHGECVEVAELTDSFGIRDTKHRELGALFFTSGEWQSFLSTARNDLL